MPDSIAPADLRAAIRDRRKITIGYANAGGRQTERTIWPLAMAYYVDVNLVGAWCELRADLRNFRVDRIVASTVPEDCYPADGGRLLQRWFAAQASAASG